VRPYTFAENFLFASVRDEAWKLLVPFDLIDGDAWLSGADSNGLIPVLFDLRADPGEAKNVLGANVEVAKRLHAALRAWFVTMPKVRIESSPRDLDAVQRMKDLGYTDGGIGIDESGTGAHGGQ
jgi:hypothetical protein